MIIDYKRTATPSEVTAAIDLFKRAMEDTELCNLDCVEIDKAYVGEFDNAGDYVSHLFEVAQGQMNNSPVYLHNFFMEEEDIEGEIQGSVDEKVISLSSSIFDFTKIFEGTQLGDIETSEMHGLVSICNSDYF